MVLKSKRGKMFTGEDHKAFIEDMVLKNGKTFNK